MDQTLGLKVKQLPDVLPHWYHFPNKVPDTAVIGAEFEVEGARLPTQEDLHYHWAVTRDGSLRGPSAEYVLRKPTSFSYFKRKSFPYLTKIAHKKNTQTRFSKRCSTHIHINVQPLYVYQVYLMAILYYLFEELALNLAGKEDRSGNFFCVGSNNSTYIPDLMVNTIGEGRIDRMLQSDEKYAAVNFTSIPKYGSLEFRALKGTWDKDEVYTWIEFLLGLRTHARNTRPEDIPTIMEKISSKTPAMYFKAMYPEDSPVWNTLYKAYKGDIMAMNTDIYNGISNIQRVFYEISWGDIIVHEGDHAKWFETIKDRKLDIKAMVPGLDVNAYNIYAEIYGKEKKTVIPQLKRRTGSTLRRAPQRLDLRGLQPQPPARPRVEERGDNTGLTMGERNLMIHLMDVSRVRDLSPGEEETLHTLRLVEQQHRQRQLQRDIDNVRPVVEEGFFNAVEAREARPAFRTIPFRTIPVAEEDDDEVVEVDLDETAAGD